MEISWRNAELLRDLPLIFCFDEFELDLAKFELRQNNRAIHLEPQVLSLLILLISNSERMVTKEEIIEKVWNGRIISDSAIASRVKSARSALHDDGINQRAIQTVHGVGFRFVRNVSFRPAQHAVLPVESGQSGGFQDDRPSIAVMPFQLRGTHGPLSFLAEALSDEIIADLSRSRWLMVIARASTFRFRGKTPDCSDIGRTLNVRYCLTGTLDAGQDRVTLSVELSRTSDSAVLWADRFVAGVDELFQLHEELLLNIVSKLEVRIVQQEVEFARAKQDEVLDAWSSYHLGLDHMYRFNSADNTRASHLFERALAFNPQFSRAYSGLSFTCFQDSFLQYSDKADYMALRARQLAEKALQCDPLDPFAHLNLGRSLWFDNAVPESLERLNACIALSPNFAQGIYSKGWAEMTQCNATASEADATLALRLSPLDPLRYAMLAVRSVSALLQGDYKTAADLGEMAARSPGAHKHIAVIAAATTYADGKITDATSWIEKARAMDPTVSPASFFRSFPFVQSAGRELIEGAFKDLRF